MKRIKSKQWAGNTYKKAIQPGHHATEQWVQADFARTAYGLGFIIAGKTA